MSPSVSETTVSPSPFSPFSSYSSTSGLTSDDAPDLGAFTTVFRALNTFHPARTNGGRFSDNETATPTSSVALSPSEYDSEVAGSSTVWSQRPIASYLSSSSPESPPASSSPVTDDADYLGVPTADSDTRDSDRSELEDDDNLDLSLQPSLGLFGALDFLAAERAKFVAERDAVGLRGNSSTTSDGTWRHALQPRRKRRRKKTRSVRAASVPRHATDEVTMAAAGNADDTVDGTLGSHDDADDSSSSLDAPSSPQYYKSTPPTPPHEKEKRLQPLTFTPNRSRIHHSKSTPTLRLPTSMPIDPRVLQLRNLAHKLRMLFPKDAASLSAVLSNDNPSPTEVVDPRGPVPLPKDTLIHVFIDHSNILFGFLNYIKQHYRRMNRGPKHMSHAALALILERGRPVTRRVLVTSSPLYQPVDSAEQLGYEVKIMARVPDSRDDRQQGSSSSGDQNLHVAHTHSQGLIRQNNRRSLPRGHSHKTSIGGTSESEPSSAGPSSARVRYREQGVDELLQLKLHQAIADVDEVPPDGTIILATGDGNVGQFNDEGFLGCVRTALKKGWKVELYSWEGSASKAFKRDFGTNDAFSYHPLDRFALDLLEI